MPQSKRRGRRARIRVGRVSVYHHHGSWWLYFRENGSPIRRRVGPDLGDARRVAAESNARLEAGRPSPFAFRSITIPTLADRWLTHHETVRQSSLATIRRYRSATRHLSDYSETRGHPPAHDLVSEDFVRYLRTKSVSPNGHPNTPKRPLQGRGVLFILGACRAMYNFAARQRLLPAYSDNPFIRLEIERIRVDDSKRIPIFSDDQAARFLQAGDPWQFGVFFAMCQTGMRPGELVHLLVEDIDLERGLIHIRGRPRLGWQIKTRRDRAIPIFDEFRTLLRRLIAARGAGIVFLRRRFLNGDRPVLAARGAVELEQVLARRVADLRADIGPGLTRWEVSRLCRSLWSDAGAIRTSRLRVEFMRVTKRMGMDHVTTPKSWRHTFATLLQDANVDPLIRQELMGHSSSGGLGMTAVYTHTRAETRREQLRRAIELNAAVLKVARQRLSRGEYLNLSSARKEST